MPGPLAPDARSESKFLKYICLKLFGMAVDYLVYGVVAVIVGLLVLIGCVVFIIQMQHPDDKLTAWFPKMIVLLGLFLACSVVLLLPFDASMSQSCQQDPNCTVAHTLAQLWYISFLSIAIMAFVIIPLAYFW
jgi:LMBR1 domain-containing protein 1